MKKININIGVIAVLLVCITSCASIKPGSVKSGHNIYETFFTGETGTQYFLKPLTFCNNSNKELKIDFTFIYKIEITDSAIVNISYLSNQLLKNIDSIKIENEETTVLNREAKYMFSERSKKIYNCRYTSKISLSDVVKLFEKNNWKISLYQNGESIEFTTPKTTLKKINKLNYQIFAIVK